MQIRRLIAVQPIDGTGDIPVFALDFDLVLKVMVDLV